MPHVFLSARKLKRGGRKKGEKKGKKRRKEGKTSSSI